MNQIQPTNAEHRTPWTRPELLRIDAGSARGGGAAGTDFASEVS